MPPLPGRESTLLLFYISILTNPSLDLNKISYMSFLASNWALLGGSLLVAAPVIIFKVKDHVDVEEDVKFSDETVDDVAPTELLEQRKHSQS